MVAHLNLHLLHLLQLQGGHGQYPAVMLSTGDHDDRVVPLHRCVLGLLIDARSFS